MTHIRKVKYTHKILIGKPEGKTPLGRHGAHRKETLKCIYINRMRDCVLDSSGSG
jgi:hypothetical protein